MAGTVHFFQTEVTGALLISGLIAYASFGVVAFQTVSYFSRFQEDRAAFKGLVGGCLALCSLDTALNGAWCWNWLVRNYGDPSSVAFAPLEFPSAAILVGVTTTTVQLFYAWRLSKIASTKLQRLLIPVLVGALSVTQLCATSVVVSIMARHPDFAYLEVHLFPIIWLWLIPSCVADLLITTSMFYFLHVKARGINSSQGVFIKIIHRSIQANALSLATELMMVITFKVKAAGFWWLCGVFTIAKSLTFSMVASLNSRDNTTIESSSHYGPSNPTSGGRHEVDFPSRRGDGTRVDLLSSVHVASEVQVDVDDHETREIWAASKRQTHLV